MGRSKKQPSVQIDSAVVHGPIAGPVNAVLCAVAVAVAGTVVDAIQAWYPLLFGAAGIAATVVARLRLRVTSVGAWFRGACWAVGTGWPAWVIYFGWSVLAVVLLVLAAVMAAVFMWALTDRPGAGLGVTAQEQLEQEQERAKGLDERVADAVHESVADTVRRKKPLTVTPIKQWAEDAGKTYELVAAPGSKFNFRYLQPAQVDIAAALELPVGCTVSAEQGTRHQGAVLLHVNTKSFMDRVVPFPDDYRVRSIVDDFSLGVLMHGQQGLVEVYQAFNLIGGKRGGGKTIAVHNYVANTLLTDNARAIIIDLNGGKSIGPWIERHATGAIKHMPLLRFAHTPETALETLEHLALIVNDRATRFQKLMIRHGTDVIIPGNGRDVCLVCRMIHPPLLLVIVDEGAEVNGQDTTGAAASAGALLQEIIRKGRAALVNVVLTSQRGTGDYLSSQVKKGSSIAVCFRVKDDAELAHFFGWESGLSASALVHKGQAYLQRDDGAVMMMKARLLLPDQIGDIVTVTQDRMPDLEPSAVSLGGEAFRDWMQHPHIAEMLRILGPDDDDDEFERTETPIVVTRPAPRPDPAAGARAALSTMGDVLRLGREAADEVKSGDVRRTSASMSDDEVNARLLEIEQAFAAEDAAAAASGGEGHTPAAEPPESTGNQVQDRYRFVVDLRRNGPVKTAQITQAVFDAGLARQRQRVSEALNAAAAAGAIVAVPGKTGWWDKPEQD